MLIVLPLFFADIVYTLSHTLRQFSQNIFYFDCFLVKEETFVSRKQNNAASRSGQQPFLLFVFGFYELGHYEHL